MRSPGVKLHKLALFGWAVVITAVLLLLSLPVLAGIFFIVPALKLTIYWKMCYIYNTQSVGSLWLLSILIDYTSVFVCCFNSKNIKKNNLRHYHNDYKNDSNFDHYIAGLIEGDGTIYIPKEEISLKGNLNYPSIQIVFHLKDYPLALLIQKELKHGSISRKKGQSAYIYTINNYDGLLLLINIINGNMKTNKIYALHKLINWYNLYKGTSLEKKGLSTEPLLTNAWLSGFIEADGHFSLRSTESGKYPRIDCKFELCQRLKDQNSRDNLFFLEDIAMNFNSEVKSIRNETKHPQYRIRTTNLKSNLIIVNYLLNYPLFGTKFLDFNDWINIVKLFEQGCFNHKLNMKKVKQIKSQMNDKRTVFVWDHLQNFYNLNK